MGKVYPIECGTFDGRWLAQFLNPIQQTKMMENSKTTQNQITIVKTSESNTIYFHIYLDKYFCFSRIFPWLILLKKYENKKQKSMQLCMKNRKLTLTVNSISDQT